jgi:predicted nuclease of predicted toxin-antitoxin system
VAFAVAAALRKHGIDVTTTQDAGLIGADDSAQLEYARQEGRVIVTHDADYLRWHSQGIEHSGIAYCHKDARSTGQIIETLRLMYELVSSEEMAGKVEFL